MNRLLANIFGLLNAVNAFFMLFGAFALALLASQAGKEWAGDIANDTLRALLDIEILVFGVVFGTGLVVTVLSCGVFAVLIDIRRLLRDAVEGRR